MALKACVLHAEVQNRDSREFLLYILEMRKAGRRWNLSHRFSDFVTLRSLLCKIHGRAAEALPRLPKNTLSTLFALPDPDGEFVQNRKRSIQDFCDALLGEPRLSTVFETSEFFQDRRKERAATAAAGESADDEWQYKILFTGDYGTGKSSLVKRYAENKFVHNYLPTLGVDFALKELHWETGGTVRLQLWDIAGQERYSGFTSIYYKEAVAAFVVFDLNRPATLHSVRKWKQDIDTNTRGTSGKVIPVVLLANKIDLHEAKKGAPDPDRIDLDTMDDFCREHGFIGWFATSAKDNIHVDDAALFLVRHLMREQLGSDEAVDAAMPLPAAPHPETQGGKSCIILVRERQARLMSSQ